MFFSFEKLKSKEHFVLKSVSYNTIYRDKVHNTVNIS